MAWFGKLAEIAGTIGGAYAGGPTGAVIGRQIGKGVGGIFGGKEGREHWKDTVANPAEWYPLTMQGSAQSPWMSQSASDIIGGFGMDEKQTGAYRKQYEQEQRARAIRMLMSSGGGM
tara:strand:+ start:12147 stop:12497 length:351 start_codon:yes stop_codon:yes gene_type:complete